MIAPLEEENLQVLNLVSAMVGLIPPSLRRVLVEVPMPQAAIVRFVVDDDDEQVQECIEDILFEFEALQAKGIDLDVEVHVVRGELDPISLPGRIVFGRADP